MRSRSQLIAVGVAVALASCTITAARWVVGEEDCTTEGDEDGNGVADCDDPACASVRACIPGCGNGKPDPGEQCDDGNSLDGDGCESDCTLPSCGNGIVDLGEQCDDGNTDDGDACDSNCTLPGCGNEVLDPGEVCDPPTPLRCSADCKSSLACGNGIVDPGEDCDDRNTSNNDACRNDCVFNRCGDGFVNTAGPTREDCDGAPVAGPGVKTLTPTNTATCNRDCTIPRCGDGKVNPVFVPPGSNTPEQCDRPTPPGNSDQSDCTVLCKTNVCGDGKRDTQGPAHFEECDDGNLIDGDTCDHNCSAPRCGNGVRDPGEQCDDSNSSCGACSADCLTVTSANATGRITSASGVDYRAGDSFTLNDGLSAAVTFQFTSAAPTVNQIQFTTTATNVDMAVRIATAINANVGLLINAAVLANTAIVTLTHAQPTINGNQPILENVATANFVVTAMTGGLGGNCASGQSCTQGIDCLSQLCNTQGNCQ